MQINDAVLQAHGYLANVLETDVELQYLEGSVDVDDPIRAQTFQLLQNRPNPLQRFTYIGFTLPDASDVKVRIMDVKGRLVSEYLGAYSGGYHEIRVDLNGREPGLYLYEMTTHFGVQTKKMILQGN